MGFTSTDYAETNVNIPTPNVPPVSNAGSTQNVAAGAAVNLDGSGSSDSDGTIASYSWSQLSGVTVLLSDATFVSPTFTAPSTSSAHILRFQLTVTDNDGAMHSSEVTVNVTAMLSLPAVSAMTSIVNDVINVELAEGSGGFGTLVYSISGLPTGLSFATSTRIISGTLSAAGTFTVTYTVMDSVTSVSQEFSWTVTVIMTAPSAPAAPTTLASSSSVIVVSFTVPSNLGGSAIIRYQTRHRVSGQTEWEDSLTLENPEDGLSITYSGLTTSTTYDFQVRAENSTDWSLWSSTGTGTTLAASLLTLSDIDSTGLVIDAQWLMEVEIDGDRYWSHPDFAPALGSLIADPNTDRDYGIGNVQSTISRLRILNTSSDVRLHDNPDTTNLGDVVQILAINPELYIQTSLGRVRCSYVTAGGNFIRFNPDSATILDDIETGDRVIAFIAWPDTM